jgi:hypothetical protein
VLRVSNVLWVPKIKRSVFLVSKIERKGYHILFRKGNVLFVPKRSSFKLACFLELGRETYIA